MSDAAPGDAAEDVRGLEPVDLDAYAGDDAAVPYVHSFGAPIEGPHVVVTALIHGNEPCGGIALARALDAGLRPRRGRLTLAFANVAAHRAYDPRLPLASRFVDEDMNRVWSADVLDGPRRSVELDRARALRPIVDSADILLDLHSMSAGGPPLMMAGPRIKGVMLALAIGAPANVVRDFGPAGGRRLRDYGGFDDPDSKRIALLLECGRHTDPHGVDVALDVLLRLLHHYEMLGDRAGLDPGITRPEMQRVIEVTHTITAETDRFEFAQPFTGLDPILRSGTLIAHDGERVILAPYDRCILVMPTATVERGQTAVRLGKSAGFGERIRPLPEPM